MSASREKKTRQDPTTQGPTQREQKKQQEAQAERRSNLQYAAVGIVCVALALLVVVWNTGLIQRNATAAVVQDVEYSTVEVQYYFNSAKQNLLNTYLQYLGSLPFDYNTSTKNQIYDAETGQTWYDYLMEQSLETIELNTAVFKSIQTDGYTMSAQAQEYLDSILSDIDASWKTAGYPSRDAYLRANYGSYITYNLFVQLITKDVLISDYMNSVSDGFDFSDADYESYYQDNADFLDSFTHSVMTLKAEVPADDHADEDVDHDHADEDELAAALEEAKAQTLAVAEEIQKKLDNGASPATLAQEYAEQLSAGAIISQTMLGSAISGATYGEWLMDPARSPGDLTISEADGGDGSYTYYVVAFEGRQRDNTPTSTVRHILVAADTDEGAEGPTDEQYAAAQEKAETILAEWKSGDSTEEAFALLAQEHSADSGSAADGGLLSNIHSGSGYVTTFADWAIDPARSPGETGIVQNTGSAIKGWHIMYYVGADGQPVWHQTADSDLRYQAYADWEESIKTGYIAIGTGLGQKFLKG